MTLKHEKLLANFAFNCNLRHYTSAAAGGDGACPADGAASATLYGELYLAKVGRCRFTTGFRS